MKKSIGPISLAILMAFTLTAGLTSIVKAGDEEAGKQLFADNKCNLCHSIESQGITKKSEKMKGAELSDVGSRVTDAKWLKGFLTQSELKEGNKHQKKFSGSDEELNTLVNWLLSLKAS